MDLCMYVGTYVCIFFVYILIYLFTDLLMYLSMFICFLTPKPKLYKDLKS